MKLRYTFTSARQYPLGKDINGKMLYPWDWVKLWNPDYRTSWIARIFYNHLDGAFIYSHPSEIRQNNGERYTVGLASFVRQKKHYSGEEYQVEKVTYKDYLKWKEEHRIFQSIRLQKPAYFKLPRNEYDEEVDKEIVF